MSNTIIKGFGRAYTDATASTGGNGKPEMPPRGGYVLKVINAGLKEMTYGTALRVQFDIDEGDHKGYFRRKYDYNKAYNDQYGGVTNWSGKYDMTLPMDKNDQYYESNMSRLKGFFTVINACNGTAYSLENDFDPAQLKGKRFGGIFTYGNYNGNEFFEFRWPSPIDKLADATIPEDRKPKGNTQSGAPKDGLTSGVVDQADFEEIISDGEVPF